MLYWMIVSSDNTATNTVISLLGYDHVNQYCRAISLTQTSLQRKMLDFQAIAEGRNNYTSPADLYRVFSLLYHGEILNKPLREVAFDFLSRCRSTDALQRYIPDAVTVLHKPGGLDHLNHDVGIFLTDDRPYYLGIFTWDGPALDGQPHLRPAGRPHPGKHAGRRSAVRHGGGYSGRTCPRLVPRPHPLPL